MDRLDINYSDIDIQERKIAGLDGVSFVTPEHGAIVTIFVSDLQLVGAVDDALHERYGGNDD